MATFIKEKKIRLIVVDNLLCSTTERLFRDPQHRQIFVEAKHASDGNGGMELPAPQEAAGILVICSY